MRATAARLGDAMLRRLLPQAVAGACVPYVGQTCYCGPICHDYGCTQKQYNCTGLCVKVQQPC